MRMNVIKIIIIWMVGSSSVFARMPFFDDAIVKHFAKQMNVSDTILHVPELYVVIHEWIGTPYKYGRSDKKGTDCSGFVRNIYLPLCGEELPRSASDMAKIIHSKPVADLAEGDLVFFNYYGRTNAHVGIYLQNGWFVHASTFRGVTLNNLHSSYYKQRFSKGGSLKQGELKDLVVRIRKNDEEPLILHPLLPIHIHTIEYFPFKQNFYLKP